MRALCDKGSRWIRFSSPNKTSERQSLLGLCHTHQGRTRVLVIKLGWPRGLPSFRVRSGARFFGVDVKLSAVLTCTDIIKMPNSALCSQVGCHWARPVRTGEARRFGSGMKDATCALDEHSIIDVRARFLGRCPQRVAPFYPLSQRSHSKDSDFHSFSSPGFLTPKMRDSRVPLQ